MFTMIRVACGLFCFALMVSVTGCAHQERFVSVDRLTAAQLRSQELFAENQNLLNANNQAQNSIAGLDGERQMLGQALGESQNQLATANTRIDNLLAERNELKERYADALKDSSGDPLMTSGGPVPNGFEFDPLTGLSKFPEDVLFNLGSAELRAEAIPVIKEFAANANSPSAQGLKILIVGHTDDQRISRPETAAIHPTNWHLSTDRANAVVLELARHGVSEERIAAMGYSKFQPLEASASEPGRQRNRRVELYIVPDSPGMAKWDPARSLR